MARRHCKIRRKARKGSRVQSLRKGRGEDRGATNDSGRLLLLITVACLIVGYVGWLALPFWPAHPDGLNAGQTTSANRLRDFGAILPVAANSRSRPAARKKNAGRSKADIERVQQALIQRTKDAVLAMAEHFHALLPRDAADQIGAIYARYSTRLQDSIEDQVRSLFEHAYKEKIFIPVENVFYDLAAKGYTQRRPGLVALEQATKQRRFQVLLVFSTNRLFRKQYLALKFVEELVEEKIRCIFTNSHIDTERSDDWRMLLQFLTFMDERGGSMYADHVRAGHLGLFLRRMVHGSLPVGYCGVDVPGEFTKRKKPRQIISIDAVASAYVRQMFEQFAVQRVPLIEIARRLNEDPDAPPPAKSMTGLWTPEIISVHLSNERYRGYWEYGRFASKWSTKKDYPQKNRRAEPLACMHFEELRIISDELWFRTQQLLAENHRGGGRPPKDGDRRSRPKIFRHLFVCPTHNRLTVGGGYGRSSFCKPCTLESSENRCLFSQLNRALAVELTCNTLARLLVADEQIAKQIIEACQAEAERLQQRDPSQLRKLKVQIDKLSNSIKYSRMDPGETEAEQGETSRLLRELGAQRAGLQQQAATLERQLNRSVEVPDEGQVRQLLRSFADILRRAAGSTSDEEVAEAREVVNALTGGRIELHQMGERRKKGGWLQGRFQLRLLSFAVSRLADATIEEQGREVCIDYRPHMLDSMQVDTAWNMYKAEKTIGEIGTALGCGKPKVRKLLKAAAVAHGESLDSAEERSKRMLRRTDKPALYRAIAEAVQIDWNAGVSLREIGRRHGCTDATVKKAHAFWHTSRGMAIPSDESRRDAIDARVWQSLHVEHIPLRAIAKEIGMTSRTLTLRLKKYCLRQGFAWVDGRAGAGKRRRKHDGDSGVKSS